ncbi:early nodulin-like protein 16 [Raphanus sativus]|uniref:Early nodulin-like protein 16 n=1 Tax=Raphanus sativus TaxID=3726 RepID=A0A9W3D0R2_RAPSA|nr:early nodulin-like protein 16 [Raphanus sativus]KAJ4866653.1 early nodulin-like protein 16 [Raphanus sativus]
MARTAVMAALGVVAFLAVEVAAKKWTVGDNKFWNPNVNYTVWAQDKHFYLDDWLYFVYERKQYNVIEVNETNYISCNSNNPIANWTHGAGRDVVHLNVTRHYYLISGDGGGCYGGMKLAVLVEKPPPSPAPAPSKNIARRAFTVSGFAPQFVIPVAVFAAIGLVWDNVVLLFW